MVPSTAILLQNEGWCSISASFTGRMICLLIASSIRRGVGDECLEAVILVDGGWATKWLSEYENSQEITGLES